MNFWDVIINHGNMNNRVKIGAKTLKLSDLISLGLNVPKFKAIDSQELTESLKNFEPLANKINAELNCEKYAVRSSALIEDSKKESFAGQFMTKIAVDSSLLAVAIKEVTSHAQKFLGGSIEKFSILVQQYIEPDIAGVTFTRNPTGGREMILEYHSGRGEDLVSGKIKPEKMELYWTNPSVNQTLPGLNKAFENFKKIENYYKFPQDIEWCIKNGEWYFLQTRPITTISETEYKQSLYLDKTLPNTDFYYEKTEISEIAERPTQITKDILLSVYAENGPIQKAYKKFKINYSPRNIIKIIGNELFVDREEDLKTLLPSYSYLNSKNLTPKLSGLKGIFRTIKNFFHIYRINLKEADTILKDLKNATEDGEKIKTIQEFLSIFGKDYQIVFEINLLAGISIKKIENLIKNEISLSVLLSHGGELFKEDLILNLNAEDLIGNTIEISDETEFVRNVSNPSKNKEVSGWWENLSEIKKSMMKEKIRHAIVYNRLREMSRWLVVKRINQLRKLLFEKASRNKFKDNKKIYFAKLDEILKEKISESTCEEREKEFKRYLEFNMPKILTNKSILQIQKTQGVSPGKTEGILIEESEIKDEKYKNLNKILYTRILSPELVRHFNDIKGIVSEQGGFLSHLAIIAREKGLPVITGIKKGEIKIGEKLKIDGNTGSFDVML